MSHNSLTTLHGELSSLPSLRVSIGQGCCRVSHGPVSLPSSPLCLCCCKRTPLLLVCRSSYEWENFLREKRGHSKAHYLFGQL